MDGLFSVILFLEAQQLTEPYYEQFLLVPLTPTDILNQTKIKEIEHKKKIILDLPYFGTNVLYYFDHHITNKERISNINFTGLYESTAASTCDVLKKFFNFDNKPEIELLIEIANTIDQATFSTPPPAVGTIKLKTKDEIIWACNDLVKDVRDDHQLLGLFDSFNKNDLMKWIKQHQKYIMNYRKKRQETLDIKEEIEIAPIIIIINNSFHVQAEGLHFSLAAEEEKYLMLVLIDKIKKAKNKHNENYRVSFRLNPRLDEIVTDKLRVDKLATQLGGGGHKGAASAGIQNFDSAFEKIIAWVKKLDINYSVNEL